MASRILAILSRHSSTLFLLCLVLIYASEISSVRSLFDEGFVSTRFLPKLLVGIALVAILAVAWRDQRAARSALGQTSVDMRANAKPILLFLLILTYIAAFRPLGFVASTFALSIGCIWLFEGAAHGPDSLRRIGGYAISAAVIAGLAYLLFAIAFGTRLPLWPDFS